MCELSENNVKGIVVLVLFCGLCTWQLRELDK